MRRVLIYVRSRLAEVRQAKKSQYRDGRIDAYEDVQEYLEDLMWEEGIDDE